MANINRVGSPMDLLDESLDEAPDKVSLRKKLLEAKQRTKSPFLIGSIDEVNKKISQLDRKLQSYTELVCESRASGYEEDGYLLNSARGRDQYQKREKETKEVCKFAGIYTLKSTFVPNLSTRVKNISKISMKPGKAKPMSIKAGEAGSKPKFVELHQYPGYDTSELTPLPGGISAKEIFNKVIKASVCLNKKPQYKPEFDRLFLSQMSEAILLAFDQLDTDQEGNKPDTFWYLFLTKFQPNKLSQAKLFNRVAHNYVKLMMMTADPLAKDTFLKDYPKLMSQAVYASFCFAFPDSYRQFGESFKDDLMCLVYGWMAGIKPSPRSWIYWDMTHLEPPNIKMREEMMQRKNKKVSSLIDFDYLDSLISTNASQYASTMSLAQSTSKSSATSNIGPTRKPRMHARISKASHKPLFRTSSPNKTNSPVSSQDSNFIEAVADAQCSPRVRGLGGRDSKRHSDTLISARDSKRLNEALTPIREMTSEDEDEDIGKKFSQVSLSQIRDSHAKAAYVMESHPMGRGCEFVRTAFNVEGRSPLVSHFLNMKGLKQEAGQVILIQRSEIDSLPPLDAKTYKQAIAESSKTIKKLEGGFQEMYQKNYKASQRFLKKEQADLREHMQKQSALLANEKEVKILCDLIILEQRKSHDSVSAGAAAAVEAALMAQD